MTLRRWAWIVAACLALFAVEAAAQPARRIAVRGVDAMGRRIDTRLWRGRRVVLVTFTGREAHENTRELLTRIDRRTARDPGLEILLVADVAAYSIQPMRGLASSALESAQRDALRERRQRRGGLRVDPAIAARFRIVADWDGRILRAFRVRSVETQPISFVLDLRGAVVARVAGSDAAAERRIHAALARARPGRPALALNR